MKSGLCYIENEWAFGSIHNELAKYLFKFGIDLGVLNWSKLYSIEEINEQTKLIDFYLTTPDGAEMLAEGRYQTKCYDKCIVVCHGRTDLEAIVNKNLPVNQFKEFVVVSTWLLKEAIRMGIARIPKIVKIGLNYDRYSKTEPVTKLQKIGYAGSGAIDKRITHAPIKRFDLAEKVASACELPLVVAQSYNNSFLTMPGFYNSVDAIIVPSSEEGAGLPGIEALAAGRLVVTTEVGHSDRIRQIGGIVLPVEESDFYSGAVELLLRYKFNSTYFVEKCQEIRRYSKALDWEYCISGWLPLFY